jgi:NitT/TauT family transport system permease protein
MAIGWGLLTLILVIIALDQLIWRPLLAWSERFKVEMIESDHPPTSWFLASLNNARLVAWARNHLTGPLLERLDFWTLRRSTSYEGDNRTASGVRNISGKFISVFLGLGLVYGIFRAAQFMMQVTLMDWGEIGLGVLATFLRVVGALVLAMLWTIPVGVLIGTNPRLAAILQPMVQIAASIPATALFPIFLLFLLEAPGGLDVAAVLLMLMGTQWYLLFNIIAGASAIPKDLKNTATLMQLKGWNRWRRLILPALFPYLVTGALTASGGAWNASIVAEWVIFRGQALRTIGIGSTIAQATASGNYPILLSATLSMVLTVVLVNRLVWRQLYRLAEDKYRME